MISAEERRHYLALDTHNVLHLTLPESEEQAARELREWRAEGVLEREAEPGVWALSQTYTGPDGIERTRNGLVVTVRLEPYENRVVLPHERTHDVTAAKNLRDEMASDVAGAAGDEDVAHRSCTTTARRHGWIL